LDNPAEAQRQWLHKHLVRNADCDFSKQHGLESARTYAEFTRRVPLISYAQLEPWIERIQRGDQQVLGSERVTHLIPTSGSTGARKLIPFTAGLQRDFNAAIAPWICDLTRQLPTILGGPSYWSITPTLKPPKVERPHVSERESASVPQIGFADDASYLGGVKARLVRAAMVVPEKLDNLADLGEFRFQTLLCLLRERDLRLISIWHPSFLTLLLEALPGMWNLILSTIHETQRRRSRELERANPRQPESLWPHLRIISCWGDGHAELGLGDLRQRFPSVHVQSKGLLATEAFVSIPYQGAHPLALRSHFFEFIDDDGDIRLAHELRAGETYEVVVTTCGGLWRYRLGDQVQVNGFIVGTPSLRFLSRAGKLTDRFGEKLSEEFVAGVLKSVFAALAFAPGFALLAPDQHKTHWHYTLFVEGDAPYATLQKQLEAALCANPLYAGCRRLGQLEPALVFRIRSGGFDVFVAHEMKRGCRLGEVKPRCLSTETNWASRFDGDYYQGCETTVCSPDRAVFTSP